MAVLRALYYFLEEASQSLWRSRLISVLSIATIGVSLFVLGAFLTVAGNLNDVVARWAQKVQVTVYLRDGIDPRARELLLERLRAEPSIASFTPVSRDEALDRFKALFRDLRTLPDDIGQNPFPESIEVNLKPERQSAEDVRRLSESLQQAPGVEEVQYDLLWIQRLATAVRLVRGLGGVLGGILALAGVFTISNVIRLTVYARQDELDIMRLVGATQAYVRGPFVMEGMLQGGLGGLVAVGLLLMSVKLLARDALAASELLGRAALVVPASLCLSLVLGGMLVGLVGSLVSLGRSQV
jgi:cell division transport system permease protein